MITFEKKTLAGCCVLAVLAAGVVCAGLFLHQTPSKSRQIFADALSDIKIILMRIIFFPE